MSAAMAEVNKFKNKYKHSHQILSEEIPTNYSLTDIKGVDLSGKVRDQGSCGSCHAHSFVQVVESRLRMKNPSAPDLSV